MDTLKQAIESQRRLLADAQAQYDKQIATASRMLDELVSHAEKAQVEQAEPKPQTAWITGNDGEKFMIMNVAAAERFEQLFAQFRGVIELLAEREKSAQTPT